MPDYRLQVISHTATVCDCITLLCEDDATARATAPKLVPMGSVAKLWAHQRYLGIVVSARLMEFRRLAADAVQGPKVTVNAVS